MLRVVLAAALLASPAAAQTLRVGQIGQQSGTRDPHRATATHDKGPASWMFDGLVRFPPGSADPSRLEPDLAERWERSADGLTWTFTLRDGVEFHHGMGRLTAEDVASRCAVRRALRVPPSPETIASSLRWRLSIRARCGSCSARPCRTGSACLRTTMAA